jgi:hypothetical protein
MFIGLETGKACNHRSNIVDVNGKPYRPLVKYLKLKA